MFVSNKRTPWPLIERIIVAGFVLNKTDLGPVADFVKVISIVEGDILGFILNKIETLRNFALQQGHNGELCNSLRL